MTADFGRTDVTADFKIRQLRKTLCILIISFGNTSQDEKLTYSENSSLNKVLFSGNPTEKKFNIPYIMIYKNNPNRLNIML